MQMHQTHVLLDPFIHWETVSRGELTVYHIGAAGVVAELLDALVGVPEPDLETVGRLLERQVGHWALILQAPGFLLASVDLCRGYPLFYCRRDGGWLVSNSARLASRTAGHERWNPLAVLELRMSGFVTGSETLFDGVSQLQAGQLALWRAGEPEPRLHRYYTFYPRQIQAEDPAMLIDQLGQATDRIFERLVDRAAGRPIWVPLSGGLDSRLIICKLAEMGYPRLTAFSYGAPGNYEAKAAARVARRLGVRWIYLPTSRASSRRFFESTMRQRYWEFAGAHCSVPNMQDIISLLALRESGRLPEDAVLVNGQTGDFISGNHILPSLMDQPISLDRVVRVIIEKHYALWKPLCTEERLEQVGQRVREVMSWAPDRVTTIQEAAAWYEAWEWQERQAKYVINGQRSYDFLGLDWQLPLWELEYMTFWPGVPLAWRYRQQLYRDYLLRYDYAALFQRFSPNLRSWPEPWSGLLMLAGLVRRLGGRRAHAAFLRYASYVGHYSYQYAPYGLVRFCRNIDPARHAVAFWGGSWLAQLGALSGELPGGADAYRLR